MSAGDILIRCRDCAGKKFWFAVDYRTKRDAKREMWRAAVRGDYIDTGQSAHIKQREYSCVCLEAERREEMIDDGYQAARE